MSRELPPPLAALREELLRSGHVVVPHGDHVCVRLPLLASVRARIEGDRLLLQPQLGPFRRRRGLALTVLAATVAGAGGLLFLGPSGPGLAVAFAALGAMVFDVARLVVTESCTTRIHVAWASVRQRMRLHEQPALPGTAPELLPHNASASARVR